MTSKIFIVLLLIALRSSFAYIGAKMGVQNECDDGQSSLEVDWDGNYNEYTCGSGEEITDRNSAPIYYSIPDFNPLIDQVEHRCMSDSIIYKDSPPLRGNHRPIWAIYGEYLYLPPQRWLHNLEHGAIVLLYHPCLESEVLQKIRNILTSCLYRYVITPSKLIQPNLPIALLSWGSKLQLPVNFDESMARAFIKKHAKIAPEDVNRQGLYDQYLLKPSEIVTEESSTDDLIVCPWLQQDEYDKGLALLDSLTAQGDHHPQLLNRRRRFITYQRPQSPYDRIYLSQLQQFNGPKFATDVLPPSAINHRFASPTYVMAGTFLGKDPFNPNTIPKYNPVNPTNLQYRNNGNTYQQLQRPTSNAHMLINNINKLSPQNQQNVKLKLVQILLAKYKNNNTG